MVSIILPTYNNAEALRRYSLPSVLRQTFSDWEVMVVNDGSQDHTVKVVQSFSDQNDRIRLIDQPKNLGLAAALNCGIKEAKGEYIYILEHDDIWLPKKLEIQTSALSHGANICICAAIIYDEKKRKFTKLHLSNLSCLAFSGSCASLLFPLPEEDNKYLGIEDGIIAARLEIAIAEGRLDPSKLVYIDEILTIMNSNPDTLSGKRDSVIMAKRYQNAIELFAKMDKYPGVAKLTSFWKKHRLYNLIVATLPPAIRKLVYFFVEKLKTIKTARQLSAFRKLKESKLNELNNYRRLFD